MKAKKKNNEFDEKLKIKSKVENNLKNKQQQQQQQSQEQQSIDKNSISSLLPISTKKNLSINNASMREAIFRIPTEPTTVTINIGRIDVRALMSQKQSQGNFIQTRDASASRQNSSSSSSSNDSSVLSLKDYLKQRSERLF